MVGQFNVCLFWTQSPHSCIAHEVNFGLVRVILAGRMSIDLNPVMIGRQGEGVVMVDALIERNCRNPSLLEQLGHSID